MVWTSNRNMDFWKFRLHRISIFYFFSIFSRLRSCSRSALAECVREATPLLGTDGVLPRRPTQLFDGHRVSVRLRRHGPWVVFRSWGRVWTFWLVGQGKHSWMFQTTWAPTIHWSVWRSSPRSFTFTRRGTGTSKLHLKRLWRWISNVLNSQKFQKCQNKKTEMSGWVGGSEYQQFFESIHNCFYHISTLFWTFFDLYTHTDTQNCRDLFAISSRSQATVFIATVSFTTLSMALFGIETTMQLVGMFQVIFICGTGILWLT